MSPYIDSMLIAVIAKERRHEIQRNYGRRAARRTDSTTAGCTVDHRIRLTRTVGRSATCPASSS